MSDATETIERPVGYGQMKPIIDAVAREYKITEAAMVSKDSSGTPAEARMVCCWLAVQLLRLTRQEIAEVFGREKHNANAAARSIDKKRDNDAYIKQVTDKLLAELQSG